MKNRGWGSRRAAHCTAIGAVVAVLVGFGAMGCSPKLPEPDSPGARLYQQRCNTCHRIFAPSTLKFEMWKFQVDRMQGEMARRGLPPLTAEERTLLLDYLKRNSG